jgi:putative glutamine amidotransferase
MGGTLFVDIPSEFKSEINHSQLRHKDRFVHEVRLEADSMLARIFGRPSIQVNSSHHQGVNRLGKGLRVTGRAPDGMPEVLELGPETESERARLLPYLLGVQFHPERLVQGHPEYIELFRSFTEAAAINPQIGSLSH